MPSLLQIPWISRGWSPALNLDSRQKMLSDPNTVLCLSTGISWVKENSNAMLGGSNFDMNLSQYHINTIVHTHCWLLFEYFTTSLNTQLILILSKLRELVVDREAWHAAVQGLQKLDTSEWLNNNRSSQTPVRCPISTPISQMKKLRQRGTNKQPARRPKHD